MQALLGRLKPLATLPSAQRLHDLELDNMHILPGSITALSSFTNLHVLCLGDVDCVLSPSALIEACARFPLLAQLTFDARYLMSPTVYEQGRRQVSGGPKLMLGVRLPADHDDKGERAAFEGLKNELVTLSDVLPFDKQWVRVREACPC